MRLPLRTWPRAALEPSPLAKTRSKPVVRPVAAAVYWSSAMSMSQAPRPIDFQARAFYRYVRHPVMVGFLIAFWATPTMSVGHLFFAAMTTAYVLVAIRLEERDLATAHGESYRQYQRQVGMLIPRPASVLTSAVAGSNESLR